MSPGDLTSAEVRLARQRGVFTITLETERGYMVTVNRLTKDGPVLLARSREYVRPRTARIYGAELVRAVLGAS